MYGMFLIFVISTIFLREVNCQTGTDARNLRTQLFDTDGYDKKVRSATNVSDPTEVWMNFYLLSINSLDEAEEKLKTTGFLYISWYDSYLRWNTSDYGGLSYTFFPQDDVWKPDVALKNSVKEYKELGVTSLNVQVSYDGHIEWQPFQMFESSCAIDVTNYPFDTQTCKLVFVAWSYTKYEVDMREGTKGIDLYDYEPNPIWEVIGSDAVVEADTIEASVIFSVTLRRKPRYLILNIILPVIMLSILNVFVFMIPCGSGEKASYAVTVFLSFAVFLTIISSSQPENSDSVSLFSIYLILQTVQSTLITVLSLVMLRLNDFESDVPRPLVCFVNCFDCRKCSNKESQVEPEELGPRYDKSVDKTVAPTDDGCTWRRVVNTMDLLLFCVFTLATFLSTVICLVSAANR